MEQMTAAVEVYDHTMLTAPSLGCKDLAYYCCSAFKCSRNTVDADAQQIFLRVL